MNAKTETLILRINPKEKELISEAAKMRGESMATLIRRAALNEAKKQLTKKEGKQMERVTGRHTGVPSYFRYSCMEASQGGTNTYATPAWHIAIHLDTEMPDDIEDSDDWYEQIDRLLALCKKEKDHDGIWKWFVDHYPRCAELVPDRRKDQFVKGVVQAYEDGRMEF